MKMGEKVLVVWFSEKKYGFCLLDLIDQTKHIRNENSLF